jgi:hypothetical protein
MRRAILALLLAASAPVQARDLLVLEWADQGARRDTIALDPIYKRSLYCEMGQGPISCDMHVLMIGRGFCPLVTNIFYYKTEEGTLRAFRRGDRLEIDLVELKADTKLRITLKTDLIKQKIVDEASGVMVFRDYGDGKVHTAELAAFVKNSKGMESYPQTEEVELNCSKISVTAAKKAAK